MRARIVIIVLVSLALAGIAQADIYYNDGGVHGLGGEYLDTIIVDNPAPPPPAYTTVEFGGQGDILVAYNNSRVTVGGTLVGVLYLFDNSQATINSISIDGISVVDNSQATIDYVSTNALSVWGNSRVTVNNGKFRELVDFGDNSQVTINGGYFDPAVLDVSESSQVTFNGGRIGPNTGLSGGGNITFVGSDFAVYGDWDRTDLLFSGFGDFDGPFPGDTPWGSGCFLWGTLKSGDLLERAALVGGPEGGHFSFVPVPLPGAVLLGVLGLGTAGWRLRRKTG